MKLYYQKYSRNVSIRPQREIAQKRDRITKKWHEIRIGTWGGPKDHEIKEEETNVNKNIDIND